MQRPLLGICMCFVAVMAAWLVVGGTSWNAAGTGSSWGEPPAYWEDKPITVTGNVYRKDSKYFYLDSVFIQNDAADQQLTIPLTENLICEYEEAAPKMGSTVTVEGTFAVFGSATNWGEFDAAAYYQTQGLAGRITEISGMVCSEEYSLWKETLFQLRNNFRQRLYDIFPEKEASIMTAMLLGDKQGLDSEIKALYQENGIIHILSISGLHITIIGMSIYKLLRRIGVPVWLAALLGGIILLLYGVMTGMSVSACRAIGMYLIKMLAEVVGRTYDMMIAMGIMAAGMVCVNPLYLKNAGFLLSYGAIVGVGIVYPALNQEDGNAARVKKYETRTWRRIAGEFLCKYGERLKQSILAGLSITLTTLPIQLWFYYEVPVYSVVLNLFVLPFMMLVMLAGLVAMLVPGLGIVGTIDCLVLSGYEWLCRCFERLPFSAWNPGRPKVWQLVAYYVIMVLVVIVRRRHSVGSIWYRIWRSRCKGEHREPGANRSQKGVSGSKLPWNLLGKCAEIVILTMSVGIFAIKSPAKTTVTFLDVGQGDCICIQLSSGEVYLFDCGSTSRRKVGEYVLKPYLKYCGVSYIDAVFVSHADQDHCSGVKELLENRADWGISAGQLVVSGEEGILWAEEICGAEESGGAEEIGAEEMGGAEEIYGAEESEVTELTWGTIQAGYSWEIGDNSFLCLHPSPDFVTDDSNAGSQCFYIELEQGVTLLLTGDVEAEGEEMLLAALQRREIGAIDVLKVAHHGSQNASKEEVLEQLKPQVAVISCGRNNSYGHPHAETLERLEAVGSEVMATADYGAITVEIGKEIKVYGFTK